MDREEILAKSRNEKSDEGLVAAENRGKKIGITAFCAVFLFITIFNFLNGQPNYAPRAMFWAFFAANAYPQYKFTQKKVYLVTVIAGTIASVASLGSFVIDILR